jgi:DNA-binding IclR family transcriptional regulator
MSPNWHREYRRRATASHGTPASTFGAAVAEQSKTVDSALTLLTQVADAGESPTAASLARTLGLSRTAVARLLATLEAHGLVRRTGPGWGPGLGLLALAAGVEPELRTLARAELEGLAARFGETAVLSVRDGDEAVAVDQVVGAGGGSVVRIHYRPGTRHPVSVAASGRALLEGGPAGAVTSEGELEPGVRGIAAAVRGRDGHPVASVAVVAPVHRFPPDDEVAHAVSASARRIGDGLAHRAAPRASPVRTGGPHAVLPAGG